MNTKLILLTLALGLISFPAFGAEERDCGAAGDGCASEEWIASSLAATEEFSDWPENGYRTYASLCHETTPEMKARCLKESDKAAKALGLPSQE